jgi:hypothetical protein
MARVSRYVIERLIAACEGATADPVVRFMRSRPGYVQSITGLQVSSVELLHESQPKPTKE